MIDIKETEVIGDFDKVGEVVTFLASDKASYITGETIQIGGGRRGMNYIW